MVVCSFQPYAVVALACKLFIHSIARAVPSIQACRWVIVTISTLHHIAGKITIFGKSHSVAGQASTMYTNAHIGYKKPIQYSYIHSRSVQIA